MNPLYTSDNYRISIKGITKEINWRESDLQSLKRAILCKEPEKVHYDIAKYAKMGYIGMHKYAMRLLTEVNRLKAIRAELRLLIAYKEIKMLNSI